MYLYLASPYTKYPDGMQAAYDTVLANAQELFANGWTIFSPIVHFHPLSARLPLDKMTDSDYWFEVNLPYMLSASGLVVLKMDGWEESAGVSREIAEFRRQHKPIMWLDEVV